MKVMKKLLTATIAMCAISSVALAADCDKQNADAVQENVVKQQAYAHPTLFKTQAQAQIDSNNVYVTGGKILKTKSEIFKKKDNVFVESWSNDVLAQIKDAKLKSGQTEVFDKNAPSLRSEVATILAEGLNLDFPASYKPYSDIDDLYWGKKWVYAVTEKGIMIGYPSGVFKPEQPITKAEVFATVAQLINVKHSTTAAPVYKKQAMKYIPNWAVSATNEVIASNLLDLVPNSQEVIDNEYLSKEQVARLVGAMKQNLKALQDGSMNDGANLNATTLYGATTVKIKLLDRLSAKTSNIGEWFTAKTTEAVTVDGVEFPADSIVRGEVVGVQRPGLLDGKEPGFIKVQFKYIKNGECKADLPKHIVSASAKNLKNPNILARLAGAPLTIVGRAAGVVGRGGAAIANVTGNGVEEVGDELANSLVETFTLHPGRGVASVGNSVVTILKGGFDITKICLSSIAGVIYEVGDELVYIIVPKLSNSSSLNPDEELEVIF